MQNPMMPRDFLIEEVRERRRQVLAEYGNDIKKLVEAIQRAQAEQPERYVNLRRLKSPTRPVDSPGSEGSV